MTDPFTPGERVLFRANSACVTTGTVARIWAKPVSDPYITIKTDDPDGPGRIFVRVASAVRHYHGIGNPELTDFPEPVTLADIRRAAVRNLD